MPGTNRRRPCAPLDRPTPRRRDDRCLELGVLNGHRQASTESAYHRDARTGLRSLTTRGRHHHAEIKSLSIRKPAAYTFGIWDRLTRFVDDARIPFDSNAPERAIRGPVVGRKNHYGSKSRRGTGGASVLYTILETCKLDVVDPAAYLSAAISAGDRNEVLLCCRGHFAADAKQGVARSHDERDQTSHPRAASRRRWLRRCPGRSRLRVLRGAGPTQSWRAYCTAQQKVTTG